MTQAHEAERTEPRHVCRLYVDNGLWWRDFPALGVSHPTSMDCSVESSKVVRRTSERYPNAVIELCGEVVS